MLAPLPPVPNSSSLTPAVANAPSHPHIPCPSKESRSPLTCRNCKECGLHFTGHTDGTCFQPGGGMEGRCEEYMNNKGCFHAMFVEYLESAYSLSDPNTSPTSPVSPQQPPTLDDDIILPPTANLCVTSFKSNFDLHDDLYIQCDSKFPFPLTYPLADFEAVALVLMVKMFNALLDSGCTHHIIQHQALFQNSIPKTISIGMANCSFFDALGSGDVEFRYPLGDRHVVSLLYVVAFMHPVLK